MTPEQAKIAERAAEGARRRLDALARERKELLAPVRRGLFNLRNALSAGASREDIMDGIDDLLFITDPSRDAKPQDKEKPR